MNYRVIGWYTPDYADLANKFSKNLEKYGIPYRLYDVPSVGKWSTQRKPEIVLRAMNDYPDDILVLMDVDCIVHGDISEITKFEGDVGITVYTSDNNNRKINTITVGCSSRVVVFRPTQGAKVFATLWKNIVTKNKYRYDHDEKSLAMAFIASHNIRFHSISKIYAGREIGGPNGALIEHDSAHGKPKRVKEFLKKIEKKFFRTGKTQRMKGF